jgi:hypothetical protein
MMIPPSQVGIQRRIDETLPVGNDDPNHIQFDASTAKAYMETDGTIYPKSHYEMELSGDAHRLFTDRDIVFNKPPNALGEMPDYLRPKHDELVQLGLLQEAMSRYPYIATVPGGFIRQNLFEIAQDHLDDPEVVVVNGKPYQIQKQKLAQGIATGYSQAQPQAQLEMQPAPAVIGRAGKKI